MNSTVSSKNLEYLWAVDNLISVNGYSPTFREIGDDLRVSSTSTVFDHIQKLVNAGLMVSMAEMPRTLRITQKGNMVLDDWKANGLDYVQQRLGELEV